MADDKDTGARLTLRAAAQRLKVSKRTLGRMIEAGTLPIDRTTHPFTVDISGLPQGRPGAGAAHAPAQGASRLQAQLTKALDENQRLSALLEQVSGERDYLRSALATALSLQRPAIEAPPARKWRWPWQRE